MKLVISDAQEGLEVTIAQVFPASWQCCRVAHAPPLGPAAKPFDGSAFLRRNDLRVIARLAPRERALLEGRLPLLPEGKYPAAWLWQHHVRAQSETVLAISRDSHAPGMNGAIFHHCWRGLFFAEAFDTEPGPPAPMTRRSAWQGRRCSGGMHEVPSMTMQENDLPALVYRGLDPDADNVTANGMRCLLTNGELIPELPESEAAWGPCVK